MSDKNKKVFSIGREGDIAIIDPDGTVSKRHAELIVDYEKQRYYLTDIGSMNGTFHVQDAEQKPFYQGYVDVDDHVLFGTYRCSIRDLLNDLQEKRQVNVFFLKSEGANELGGSNEHGELESASIGIVNKKKEITGARRRCSHCGVVILISEKECSQCKGKQ